MPRTHSTFAEFLARNRPGVRVSFEAVGLFVLVLFAVLLIVG